MSVVATDSVSFVEHLPGRLRRAGVLIAKRDMPVDEIAYGLDPSPAVGRIGE